MVTLLLRSNFRKLLAVGSLLTPSFYAQAIVVGEDLPSHYVARGTGDVGWGDGPPYSIAVTGLNRVETTGAVFALLKAEYGNPYPDMVWGKRAGDRF